MNQGVATAGMSREDRGFEIDPANDAKGSQGEYRGAPAVDPERPFIMTQPAKQPLATTCSQPASLRILAVDDDPLVLMNVAALIEDLGHSVIEAASGKAALEILRGGQPIDLLVTDQSMPGMTGVELAAAANDAAPGIRIVIATGYAELPAGTVPFVTLQKPFLDDDLARAIDRAMNGQS
jgi:CheY-like chemotaxis protein